MGIWIRQCLLMKFCLHHFLNYEHLARTFEASYNPLLIRDGQGKASLLESLYVTFYWRSFCGMDVVGSVG